MEYMLNELSVKPVHVKSQVETLMRQFVLSAIEAEKSLLLNQLRIDEELGNSLYDLYLMENYSIGQWIEDRCQDKDIQQKFLSIISLSPLISKEEQERFFSENCIYQGILAKGLKAALLLDTYCINFLTDTCWNDTFIPVEHEYWEEGNIKTERAAVKCFSTVEHVKSHVDSFRQQQEANLQRSRELWEKRDDFFPNLVLCPSVKTQIARLGMSIDLGNVIERLRVLDLIASRWESGSLNYGVINKHYNLTIHSESQLTLDNYGTSRRFALPNGEKRVFSLHILVGGLRIHFYPDVDEHVIYIGYIGPHVKTWLYR